MSRPALFVLLALTGIFVAQTAIYVPQMPERVASHFDMGGDADGWMRRGPLAALALLTALLTSGLMLAIAFTLRRLPDSLINLPHKEHWLAPERRDESLRYLSTSLVWIGCATTALMLVVFQSIYQANLDGSGRIGWVPMALLGVYLAAIVAVVARMFLRFRLPR